MVSWQVGYAPGVALLLLVLCFSGADTAALIHLWWVLGVAMTWQEGGTHPGTHPSSLRRGHRAMPLHRSRGFRGSARSYLVVVILLGFLWWLGSP